MIKVEKLWSWLPVGKKGTRSSKKDGLVYREFPAIPEPKARVRARYTLVLINDSGKSRQIEFTPFRLRMGLIALVGVFCLLATVVLVAGGFILRSEQSAREFEDLSARVRTLQEELGRKEQALTIQEKRLKEMQETRALTAAPAVPADTSPLNGVASSRAQVQPDGGPAKAVTEFGTGLREQSKAEARAATEYSAEQNGAEVSAGEKTTPAPDSGSAVRKPQMNFDVQDVVAVQEAPNDGKISFQIVKDQPDVRFTGYLFVFVEMADRRGETKVYAYPGHTTLGEGDLPANFRVGEIIKEFRYNSRVKLDYKDSRQTATLAGVSILLYGDDGKIVYQRHLDLKEMKLVSAKNARAESARSKPAHKRQAL